MPYGLGENGEFLIPKIIHIFPPKEVNGNSEGGGRSPEGANSFA